MRSVRPGRILLCQFLVIQLALLAGCGGSPAPATAPPVGPTGTPAEAATEPPTATTSPTATTAPTPTPPLQPQPITEQNAADLKPIMSLGRGAIADIVWSPDSAAITVATTQGLWTYTAADLTTVSHIETAAPQNQVEYSPDGAWLASGGIDGVVTLWDAATGKEIRHWQTEQKVVSALAFNADGSQLAASSYAPDVDFVSAVYPAANAIIQVWSTSSGEQSHHLESRLFGVFHLIYTADGKLLSGGQTVVYCKVRSDNGVDCTGGDGTIEVWDPAQDKAIAAWKHGKNIVDMVLMADGKLVTSATQDVEVDIWNNVATGAVDKFRPFPSAYGASVVAIGASPDGSQVIANGFQFTSDVYGSSGMYGFKLPGFTRSVEYEGEGGKLLTYSPDGTHVAGLRGSYPTSDQALRIWDAKSGAIIATAPWHSRAEALSPALRITDADSSFSPRPSLLAIAPDRSTILAGGTAWRLADGQAQLLPASVDVAVGYSADGRRIITGGTYAVTVWNASTYDRVEDIIAGGSAITAHTEDSTRVLSSMVISPDGTAAAISWGGAFAGKRYTMLLDITGKRKPDRTFFPEGYDIWGLSSGGHVLAIDEDGYQAAIRFFTFEDSWQNWKYPYRDIDPSEPIIKKDDLYSAGLIATWKLNADGSQGVACGVHKAIVSVWDVVKSTKIGTLSLGERGGWIRGFGFQPPENRCLDAAYSPDGSLLALALFDGTIRLYDPTLKTEIAKLTAGRPQNSVTFSRDGKMLAARSADGIVRVWEVLK